MEYAKRKQIRLQDYDYSTPGAYFITICTQDRRCVLSDIVVGADALGGPSVRLSEFGMIVNRYILSSESMSGIHVEHYVIMPNHVHMIIRIDKAGVDEQHGPPRALAPTIPDVVGALKRLVNRAIGENIWQRSYHEHVIRNEQDYLEIWNYIDGNPAKWADDRYFEADQPRT